MKPKPPAIIAAALLFLTAAAGADTVKLEWDRNPEPDIAGYRVYLKAVTQPATPPGGAVPPPVVSWKQLGETEGTRFTVINVTAPRSTYAVTAFNAGGKEGPRSNELEVALSVVAAPKGLTGTASKP